MDVQHFSGIQLCRPLLSHNLGDNSNLVACCIIMHNMCVSDRIMGDVYMRYNPEEVEEIIERAPIDEVVPELNEEPIKNHAVIGLRNGNPIVIETGTIPMTS